MIDKNTFLFSDIHFTHRKLFEIMENKERSKIASTLEEFETKIIYNWNSTVSNNDVILFLGDFTINKRNKLVEAEYIKFFTRKLNGFKILLKGNHDTSNDLVYLKAGWNDIISEDYLIYGNILFSHFPACIERDSEEEYNDKYLSRKTELVKIFKENNCILNIHGHCHSYDFNRPELFNVSCESVNFKPIQLKQILEIKGINK